MCRPILKIYQLCALLSLPVICYLIEILLAVPELGMGMGLNHWEWEGMGLKRIFPLISNVHRRKCCCGSTTSTSSGRCKCRPVSTRSRSATARRRRTPVACSPTAAAANLPSSSPLPTSCSFSSTPTRPTLSPASLLRIRQRNCRPPSAVS